MEKSKILSLVATIVILVAVGIFVAVVFTQGSTPATFTLNGDKLAISGSYSKEIDIAGANVTMINDIDIVARTNGSNAGSARKGSFTINVSGVEQKAYLNVSNISDNCFIMVVDKLSNYYIVSCADSASTTKLFEQIIANV